MQKNESTENYLERIYMLSEAQGNVRSIDVADALGFSKPSVSNAMKRLQQNGYVIMDGDHSIHLTDEGTAIARRVYQRHEDLAHYFMAIGVSEANAYKDACMIEHDISEETYACILAQYEKLK